MGALRINLTDGTSTYIDLTNATAVSVSSSSASSFVIDKDGALYTVNRFATANPADGSGDNGVIWTDQMGVAYDCIAADPIRYGYPNLGATAATYIQYDDEKFLAAAIDSALSNTSEPAVLSNRTALAHTITDNAAAKAANSAITTAVSGCDTDATTMVAACIKAVNDAGCVAPGYDVSNPGSDARYCSCADEACCNSNLEMYTSICLTEALDAYPIQWRHQYLFASVAVPEEPAEEVFFEGPAEEKAKV